MELETLVVGPLQCNCRVLISQNEAIVIDPGDEGERIQEFLLAKGVNVKYLLHTHAHFDHFGATSVLRQSFHGKVAVHPGDKWLYENLKLQGNLFGFQFDTPAPVEKWLEDEEVLAFGGMEMQVIHTPGHSPGSVCFWIRNEKEQLLFSGDTLFRRSVGRADLWGGDSQTLLSSIEKRLFGLPAETVVLPGHGPNSTIDEEKSENPFFS